MLHITSSLFFVLRKFKKRLASIPPHPYNPPRIEFRSSSFGMSGSSCGCSSVVERNLAKVDVVGSSPIIRSLLKVFSKCKWFVLLDF